jgi:ABC-type nitrate/sulfonate/bicarbonate transport system substrate-binding protein
MIARVGRLAILIAALATQGAHPARAAEQVRASVAARVIFAIPYWIAERNGYFRDEGIDATLDVGVETAQATKHLLDGTQEIQLGGPDAILIDATKGGPLRIIAGIVRRPPLWLITQPSIRSFAQLRGANIGVLSLTEGSSKLLLRMAKAEGLAPGDFTLTRVGGAPARHNLLKAGKIDGGMQPLPLNYEGEDLGMNNLSWAGTYEPEWQFITVNANRAWAAKNPKIATGFIRALLRGQEFLSTNPSEAARIASDVLKTPVSLAERSLAEAMRLGILDPRLDWSETGLRRIYENMQADGAIPMGTTFDIGKVTAVDYLRAAQDSLRAK